MGALPFGIHKASWYRAFNANTHWVMPHIQRQAGSFCTQRNGVGLGGSPGLPPPPPHAVRAAAKTADMIVVLDIFMIASLSDFNAQAHDP
jgi:hypothetical protein